MFFDRFVTFLEKISIKYWLLFAFFTRLILSFTYQTYNHPDEWYQTVEFSNLMWGKKATYSPEIYWHMRNLTWPWILSLVSRLTYLISPSMILQTFSIHLFCSLLDLIGLWSIIKIIKKLNISNESLWIIFFSTAHFLLKDSHRPSQDHISTILFYCTLSLAFHKKWFWAGLLTSLIGVSKYAAGLLSVGLYISFFLMLFLKNINLKDFFKIQGGIILGILLGGLADLYFYGVYYQSMWSYFYFNIYSGLMNNIFGEQTVIVFIQFLLSQWKVVHFSFFVLGLLAVIKNFPQKFKENILLFLPILVLIIGNSIIKHKEGRFITQIEIGLWLILALGFIQSKFNIHVRRLLSFLILLNIVFSISNLPAELNKPTFSYFKLPTLIKDSPKTCAAITLKRPLGLFHLEPTVPQAFWHLGKKDDLMAAAKNLKLVWFIPHQCKDGDTILLQTFKQDASLLGCSKMDSWGSKWFRCPVTILANFTKQEHRSIFIERFPDFEQPTFSTPPEVMLNRQKLFEEKMNLSIGSMPDL
jgi:hypothetical protein